MTGVLGAGRLGAGSQRAALARRAVDPGVDPAAPALDRPAAPARALDYGARWRVGPRSATTTVRAADRARPRCPTPPSTRRCAGCWRRPGASCARRPRTVPAAAARRRPLRRQAGRRLDGRRSDRLRAGGVVPPSAGPPSPPPPEQRLTLKADLRAVGLITSRHADLVRANGAVFVAAGRRLDPLLELRAAATTRAHRQPASSSARSPAVGSAWSSSTARSPAASSCAPRPPTVRPGAGPGPASRRGRLPDVDPAPAARSARRGTRGRRRPPTPIVGRPPTRAARPSTAHRRPRLRGPDGHRAAAGARRDRCSPASRPRSPSSPTSARSPMPRPAASSSLTRSRPPPSRSARAATRPTPTSARVGSMVRFGDTSLATCAPAPAATVSTVAPTFDRIMAYPELAVPGAPAARPLRPHAACCPASTRSRPTPSRCSRRTPASSPRSSPG